ELAIYYHLVLSSLSIIPLYLHSFPTRRSSDLPNTARARRKPPRTILAGPELPRSEGALTNDHRNHRGPRRVPDYWYPLRRGCPRSEEHTSELQSRENL